MLRKSEVLVVGSKEVKLKGKVAEGGYGAVYKCKDKHENKYYALKVRSRRSWQERDRLLPRSLQA